MNNNPFVSIIMPAYNVEKYISESINSVIIQTYKNWELIIIDDCSTDNTKTIIQKFLSQDNRIKAIFRKENGGKPSISKNSAFEMISGKYVAFLDSDDLWMEKKLEKQVLLMEKLDCSLCYTGGFLIDENSKAIGSFLPKYDNGFIFPNMLRRYEINNQSVIIKKKFFRKFNEDITIGEDYNLFMGIVISSKVCNIKEKLIKYRVHSDSITKSNTKDLSEGTLFTLNELNNKYKIFRKYFFSYIFCWLKAVRFKFW